MIVIEKSNKLLTKMGICYKITSEYEASNFLLINILLNKMLKSDDLKKIWLTSENIHIGGVPMDLFKQKRYDEILNYLYLFSY